MKRPPRRPRPVDADRVRAALAKIRATLEADPTIRARTRAYLAGELPEGPKGAA